MRKADELVELGALVADPQNARTHSERNLEAVAGSLQRVGAARSIVIDEDGVILAGNATATAAAMVGMHQVRVIDASGDELIAVRRSGLTAEQKVALALADNRTAELASWDTTRLAQLAEEAPELMRELWDGDELSWLLEEAASAILVAAGEGAAPAQALVTTGALLDRFLAPPFSVLDSRQGYWRNRRRAWHEVIGDKTETREGSWAIHNLQYGKWGKGMPTASLLDPVLAELVARWWCPEGGQTLDMFAGDTVFGFVSATLGRPFAGIELRPEQAELNQARCTAAGLAATYHCADARQAAELLPAASVDLVFSCPPYFDLEVYSELPADASAQPTYQAYLELMREAFAAALSCLKPDRFFVLVLGDVRDKAGVYRHLVSDCADLCRQLGLHLYNQLVLVNSVGTAAVRAGRYMSPGRKVVTVHQSMLVFWHGDPRQVGEVMGPLELGEWQQLLSGEPAEDEEAEGELSERA